MGILIPDITNAKENFDIEILTLEKKTECKDDAYYVNLCKKWSLTKSDVKSFFETAKPFVFDMELNSFNIFDCEVEGKLLINGVKRNYSINLGGSAFIYDNEIQEGYGCKKGKCLKYVNYEPFQGD